MSPPTSPNDKHGTVIDGTARSAQWRENRRAPSGPQAEREPQRHDSDRGIVAASAPKGGLITYWDVGARRFLGSCELNDGCGIAPTRHKASFLLTSGQGWLVETDVADAPGEDRHSSPYEWDNHAILVR